MKTRNHLTHILLMFACLMAALPALASSIVYSNGPFGGIDGWTINFGFSVADSFYLGAQTQVTGTVFYVVEFPGDTVTSVNWQITGGAKLNKTLPHGIADTTNSHGQGLLVDKPTFSYDTITLTLPPFILPAGTYWITFSNAVTAQGNPVYWDENDGIGCTGWKGTTQGCPSLARENSVGTIPSESFSIWGN